MNRVIAVSIVLTLTGLAAQAERSVFEREMDLRVSTLKQCAKLDPSNKSKFEAQIQQYRQETKPLLEKVQKIIIAEVPSTPAATSLGVIEKWSASESQRNIDFQVARREQFMQKCDYAINPADRKKYGATAARDASIVGLPHAEYPDDARAINAWKP